MNEVFRAGSGGLIRWYVGTGFSGQVVELLDKRICRITSVEKGKESNQGRNK